MALLSFIGVGLVGFTFFGKVVRGSPIPCAPGIGALGALMLALCPLFTHVGFWLWRGEFDSIYTRNAWDGMWYTDGPGIWLALAAGIIALIGAAAVSKREGRSF